MKLLVRTHMLLFIALLGFIIGVPGYILSAQNYDSHYGFMAQNGKPLKIVTARGETVTLGLQVDGSISGHWASAQGLTLTLDGISSPLQVVQPKEQDWGDHMTVDSRYVDEIVTVNGNITIPSSLAGPEQRVLTGTLSGSIVYPSGGILFQDKTLDVNVPVQIQLVPQGTMLWSGGRLFFYIFAGLEILCAALLVLLGVWTLLRTVFGKREKLESRSGGQIFKDWLWGLAGGTVVALICALIVGGLLVSTSNSGLSHPGEIGLLSFLIGGLVGLSTWFGVLAKMVKDDGK